MCLPLGLYKLCSALLPAPRDHYGLETPPWVSPYCTFLPLLLGAGMSARSPSAKIIDKA